MENVDSAEYSVDELACKARPRHLRLEIARRGNDQAWLDGCAPDRVLLWPLTQPLAVDCGDLSLRNYVRKIEQAYYKASGDPTDRPPAFLDEMIAQNQMGESTGRGFYTYPDPEYRRPGFLEGDAKLDEA